MAFEEIFKDLFIVLVAFSGYAVGHILVNLAYEEIKSGKVYFFLLRDICALFLIFFLLSYTPKFIYAIIPSVLIILLLIFSIKKTNLGKEQGMYIALFIALLTTFFTKNQDFIFLTASLIFVYLLASVALLRGMQREKRKRQKEK